jgi:hypothetical protein
MSDEYQASYLTLSRIERYHHERPPQQYRFDRTQLTRPFQVIWTE